MKKKFFGSALLLSFYNIVLAFVVFEVLNQGILLYILTAIGGTVLLFFAMYNWLIRPVLDLKRQLEDAENIRKEFVANVTHEFKTPLTSIAGFIETLQDGAHDNPEIREKFLDIIAIETARLARLIEDLLIISEMENRKNTDHNETFDIKLVLSQILETMEPIANGQGIRIILEAENQLVLHGSEDRFRQMLVNLIENAIKYSGSGKLVTVGARDEKDHIRVYVKDRGIGIATENIPRLFERFYRVDKSRSQKMGGTGLGLSIVKHAAALFSAQLTVDSALGEGSTFSILFPK
jgi:two-component system phosphate regulon sensor histidine kinase PhoR